MKGDIEIFLRKTIGHSRKSKEPLIIVSGIAASSGIYQLQDEAVYRGTIDLEGDEIVIRLNTYDFRSVREQARGKGVGNLLMEPLWTV